MNWNLSSSRGNDGMVWESNQKVVGIGTSLSVPAIKQVCVGVLNPVRMWWQQTWQSSFRNVFLQCWYIVCWNMSVRKQKHFIRYLLAKVVIIRIYALSFRMRRVHTRNTNWKISQGITTNDKEKTLMMKNK